LAVPHKLGRLLPNTQRWAAELGQLGPRRGLKVRRGPGIVKAVHASK